MTAKGLLVSQGLYFRLVSYLTFIIEETGNTLHEFSGILHLLICFNMCIIFCVARPLSLLVMFEFIQFIETEPGLIL
jgi:hypothetical protein